MTSIDILYNKISMKISPDNPHFQRLKTELYYEGMSPVDFQANAKHAKELGMSPADYRASIRVFPFLSTQGQIDFIMNW